MRRLGPPILLLLIAFLGGVRSLGFGHMSDDWAILSHVSRHGNADAWTGPWLGMKTLKFHRPVFTGLYAAEYALFGTDPFPAHLHHLLWHVAAVGLLWSILRRLGAGPGGAFLGGLFFALHPYLPGATGWLAGRCGTVAGTLTLAAVRAWLGFRRPDAEGRTPVAGAAAYALALAAAAAAALTRESGYLAFVAPLTLDLVALPRRPSLVRLAVTHLPFAAAGAALLALRRHALGTFAGGYPNPEGLMKEGAAVEVLGEAGEAMLRLAGGLPPEFTDHSYVLPAAAGVATLAILVLGLYRAGRAAVARPALALLALLAAQVALLVLTGPILTAATGQRWYAAIAFLCGLLGLASGPLLARDRLYAPWLLVPAFLGGHFAVQHQLALADASVKRTIRSIIDQTRAEEAKRGSWVPPMKVGPIFVSCLPGSRAGLPTFHWGLAEALRPPFQERELPSPVYPVHRWMYLGRGRPWEYHPPVEALLHVQGKFPFALGFSDSFGMDDDTLANADIHTLLQSAGDLPAKWPCFGGEVLEIQRPADPTITEVQLRGRPLEVWIRVAAQGCHTIEFFEYLPTVDMRHPIPVTPGVPFVETNLGIVLEDYACFRNEEVRIYVVPVGHRHDRPDHPLLGHAVTYVWRP